MTKSNRKGEAAAKGPQIYPGWALVLGIASIALGVFLAGFPFIGLGLGIAGLALSVHAQRLVRTDRIPAGRLMQSCCTAAFVTSLVGTILCVVYVLIYFMIVHASDTAASLILGASGLS